MESKTKTKEIKLDSIQSYVEIDKKYNVNNFGDL